MIYVRGGQRLSRVLGSFEHTENHKEAKCAVVELPGFLSELNNIPEEIPIYIVINGMLALPEWKATNASKVITASMSDIVNRVSDMLNNPAEMFDDDLDEDIASAEPPETIIKEEKPVNHRHRSGLTKPPEKSDVTPRGKSAYIGISFSSAGGVGKTFLCSNLATCTAIEGVETVAVDFDLRSSELDFAIGLVDPLDRRRVIDRKAKSPKDGWATVANWRSYPQENLKENILRHSSGLFVVPCFPTISSEIAEHEVNDLIHTLAEYFDFIMIDAGLDFAQKHIKTALKLADAVYLVGDQEIKTIGKVSAYLAQAGTDLVNKTKLVINMVNPTGYFAPDEVAAKLGFEEFDTIPLDIQGVQAARRSRKTTVQIKGSAAGEAVWKLAAEHLPYGITLPANKKHESFLCKLKKRLPKPLKRSEQTR